MAVKLPGGMSAEFMTQTSPTDETTVLLYVKAGMDGISYGACPFCQSAIMMLLSKAEVTYVSYKIKTVELRNPPDEFKLFSNKVPLLRYGETINITDMDEFLNFFDSIWADHRIETKRPGALGVVRDLFSKFCFFIKGVANSPAALLRELTKVDRYLANVKTPFMDGDSLTYVDCLLLPKLQHIRVAAKIYRDFDIPLEMTNLWRYMHSAYSTKIFRASCPTDQEILHFWSEYPNVPRLTGANRKKYSVKAQPIFTLEVPEQVRPAPVEASETSSDQSAVAEPAAVTEPVAAEDPVAAKDPVAADETAVTAESSAAADETAVTAESSAAPDETPVTTESSVAADETAVTTESSAAADETAVTTESSAAPDADVPAAPTTPTETVAVTDPIVDDVAVGEMNISQNNTTETDSTEIAAETESPKITSEAGIDSPKISLGAEVKDEDRDSGNEEQCKEDSGESDVAVETNGPTKHVTFMHQEGDSPSPDLSVS